MKPAPIPTKEEIELIRDSVLLPIMLTIVENNKKEIEWSTYSIKGLFVAANEALMKLIHADLVKVKNALRERNIKVWEDDRPVDYAIHYRFNCRGYEDQFSIMRELVRAEVGIRLGKYVAQLFKDKM